MSPGKKRDGGVLMTKLLMISTAMLGLAVSTIDASSAVHRTRGHVLRSHGRPGPGQGLGLSKQTRTGGPSGGQAKTGGAGS